MLDFKSTFRCFAPICFAVCLLNKNSLLAKHRSTVNQSVNEYQAQNGDPSEPAWSSAYQVIVADVDKTGIFAKYFIIYFVVGRFHTRGDQG